MSFVIPISDNKTETKYRKVFKYLKFIGEKNNGEKITHSDVITQLIDMSNVLSVAESYEREQTVMLEKFPLPKENQLK